MKPFSKEMLMNLSVVSKELLNLNCANFLIDKFVNMSFIRDRKFTLVVFVLSIMRLGLKKSKDSILSNNYMLWHELNAKSSPPSDRAFRYLSSKFCPDKMLKWSCRLSQITTNNGSDFFGHPVLFVDGTRVNVPRNAQTIREFGFHGNKKGALTHYPQMNLLSFTRRGTAKVEHVQIGHSITSERRLLLESFKHLPLNSIIVADRGFDGFAIPCLIHKSNRKFLIRLSSNSESKRIKKLKFKKGSAILKLHRSSDTLERFPELNNEESSVSFRVIRVKNAGIKKESVFLLTNLTDISARELADLYNQRQEVENTFNFTKNYGGLEHIHHNTKIRNIKLAIAGIFAYHNLVHTLIKKKVFKNKKKFNVRATWCVFFVCLIKKLSGRKDNLKNLETYVRRASIKLRPFRHHPRINKRPINRFQLDRKRRLKEFNKLIDQYKNP